MAGGDGPGHQPATVETPSADRGRPVSECDEFVAVIDDDELSDAAELRVEHCARAVAGTECPHLDHAVEVAAVHGVAPCIDLEPWAGFGVPSFAQIDHPRRRSVSDVERDQGFGPGRHQVTIGLDQEVVRGELGRVEGPGHLHRLGIDCADRSRHRAQEQGAVQTERDGRAAPDVSVRWPGKAIEPPDQFPGANPVHRQIPIESTGDGHERTISVDGHLVEADRWAHGLHRRASRREVEHLEHRTAGVVARLQRLELEASLAGLAGAVDRGTTAVGAHADV